MSFNRVIEHAGESIVGQLRQVNEDAWGVSDDARVFVVADASGHFTDEATAAELAVAVIREAAAGLPTASAAAGMEPLAAALLLANERIHGVVQRERSRGGDCLGVCAVAALRVDPPWIVSAHAGDCRIYQYRPGSQPRAGGGLWRLTLDHDYFASLQREGLGPAAAAEAASVHSNVITRALGLREEVGVEVQYLRADAGDLFLLCSDGLTRQLTDSRIQAILAEDDQSLAKRCRRLLRAADEERGSDNVTAVLLRLG